MTSPGEIKRCLVRQQIQAPRARMNRSSFLPQQQLWNLPQKGIRRTEGLQIEESTVFVWPHFSPPLSSLLWLVKSMQRCTPTKTERALTSAMPVTRFQTKGKISDMPHAASSTTPRKSLIFLWLLGIAWLRLSVEWYQGILLLLSMQTDCPQKCQSLSPVKLQRDNGSYHACQVPFFSAGESVFFPFGDSETAPSSAPVQKTVTPYLKL